MIMPQVMTPKSVVRNLQTPKSFAFSSNKVTAEIETSKLIDQNNENTKNWTLYSRDMMESTKPVSLLTRDIKDR